MIPAPIRLDSETARRFHRRALGIDTPHRDVAEALDHHGYVQIDPINVCGRMHDLILRNRVKSYREGDLHRHVHGPEHPGLEYYLPGTGVLVAMPSSAYPQLARGMRQRRRSDNLHHGRLTSAQARLARCILRQIEEEGPLSSDAIEHGGTVTGAWGVPGRSAKVVLEKLYSHGRVLIADRRKFRRVYDLPERILPSDILQAREPTPKQHQRWIVTTLLKQRRLVILRPGALAVVKDLVQPFAVEGCPMLYGLRSDLALLDQDEPDDETRLIAPLDPLIYDRRVTAKLWDFSYTWEVYTPVKKRVRGYYALPLLNGTRLAGHVDLRADRKTGRLNLVSRQVGGRVRYAAAVKGLAEFLGLKSS